MAAVETSVAQTFVPTTCVAEFTSIALQGK